MDIQTIIIASLIVTEVALTWRIWKLERRMMQTMKHFVDAKDFLGHIKDVLSKYRGVAENITENGLDIKLKSEKFGELELNIKGRDK